MNWLAFILMLPHLKPKCLDILSPTLYRGLDVLRVLSLLVICALFLRAYIREKKLPSLPSILLGVMEGWICLITLITHGDFVESCSLAVSVAAVVLLVDLYADRMKALLTALMLNYEWLVYANLYTVWKYPGTGFVRDAVYDVELYFFGPDNWFMYLCIPAVCVALLYLRVRWKDRAAPVHILRALCLIAAAYASVLICRPVTALAAMAVLAAVLLLSLLLGLIPGIRCCVTFPAVLLGGIAADWLITVSRITETVPAIAEFITGTLDKSPTLSSRTYVWNNLQTLLDGHVWTGIGIPRDGYLMQLPALTKAYDHMHNQYFDLLVQGGIPALALFLAVLLLAGKALTVHHRTPAARIMTACMASLLVMCIPEVCRHGSIFLLFPLAYHVQKAEAAAHSPAR